MMGSPRRRRRGKTGGAKGVARGASTVENDEKRRGDVGVGFGEEGALVIACDGALAVAARAPVAAGEGGA